MPEGSGARDRSISNEYDSDNDSQNDGIDNLPGKPGRKKNPNSQAARRDQNRIAQREFRLRKQQRIRDLEARVELLSGGQDEALTEIRKILKDLMQENQTLRGLLRNLSSFIGEGAGGLLPKLGWSMDDFENFINRTETDTAWESFQKRKKNSQANASTSGTQVQKRPSEEHDAGLSRAKKAKSMGDIENGVGSSPNGFNFAVPQNSMFPHPARPSHEAQGAMFSDLIRTSPSTSLFMQSPTTTSPTTSYGVSPGGFQQAYLPSISLGVESSVASMSYNSNGGVNMQQGSASQPNQIDDTPLDENDDPSKNEAYKLLHYHLDNFKRNSAYCLPASLRPTLVQRTVPHERAIDQILHPELRDRMILLRGRIDLVECLLDYRAAVTIHGDDVLAHANWEISEKWLRQYGFLIDQNTLNISNRWRRERGEAELRLSDIAPQELQTGAS